MDICGEGASLVLTEKFQIAAALILLSSLVLSHPSATGANCDLGRGMGFLFVSCWGRGHFQGGRRLQKTLITSA